MKRLIFVTALFCAAVFSSCNEFDDTEIWNKLDNHEERISALEELCKQMNTNISALQTIVTALQDNDYVTGVAPITKEGETIGYTITFSKSDPITIYHGKDGHTPQIGVKPDSDNIHYWTLDGDWLLDDSGNKIQAQGISPKLKVEDDYWHISYDNGTTWEQLGKATGEDGDSFFKDVYTENGYVYFVLNNEIIKIAYITDETIVLVCEQEGDVTKKLTNKQKRTTTHLAVEGYITNSDVRYLGDQMLALEILDLRKTTITEVPEYAFCKGALKDGKESLREIYLPETCTSIGEYAFYGCVNLEILNAPNVINLESNAISYCNIKKMIISLGGTNLPSYNCKIQRVEYNKNIKEANSLSEQIMVDTVFCHTNIESINHFGANYSNIIFEEPANITTIESGDFSGCSISSFKLPSSIKIIKPSAFSNCKSLSTFIITDKSQISNIESEYYYNSGSSMSGSYTGAFYYGLQDSCLSIICMLPTPIYISYLFYHSTSIYGSRYKSNGNLYVPRNSITLYENSNWNGQFANIIAIEDSEYSYLLF